MRKLSMLFLLLLLMACESNERLTFLNLDAEYFKERIEEASLDNEETFLIDVRSYSDYIEGHIEGAINLDFEAEDFDTRLAELDKAAVYYVYCRTGNRSDKVMKIMKDSGFKNVLCLKSGITDWKEKGFPIKKTQTS